MTTHSLWQDYLHLIDDVLSFLQHPLPAQPQKKPTPSPLPYQPPSSLQVLQPTPSPTKQKSSNHHVEVDALPKQPPQPVKQESDLLFQLNSPTIPSPLSFSLLHSLLKICSFPLQTQNIPDDHVAKEIRSAWKDKKSPSIPIFFQGHQHLPFLKHLAKAISIYFFPSSMIDIEKEIKWDLFFKSPQLRLIISPDHVIFNSKELLSFYREKPPVLGSTPLLLVRDFSLYYQDPHLKRALWNMICQTLKKI